MDVLFKRCDGSVTVTLLDGTTPITGAAVTGTMKDYTGATVPEMDNVTFTAIGGGEYQCAIEDTFNPPTGICRIDIMADKSGVITRGFKFIEAKDLIIP